MAAYDYRCGREETLGNLGGSAAGSASPLEVRRSIAAADEAARCPDGHADVTRVWSAVALAGRGTPTPAGAGGCCGGGCCR